MRVGGRYESYIAVIRAKLRREKNGKCGSVVYIIDDVLAQVLLGRL